MMVAICMVCGAYYLAEVVPTGNEKCPECGADTWVISNTRVVRKIRRGVCPCGKRHRHEKRYVEHMGEKII